MACRHKTKKKFQKSKYLKKNRNKKNVNKIFAQQCTSKKCIIDSSICVFKINERFSKLIMFDL